MDRIDVAFDMIELYNFYDKKNATIVHKGTFSSQKKYFNQTKQKKIYRNFKLIKS